MRLPFPLALVVVLACSVVAALHAQDRPLARNLGGAWLRLDGPQPAEERQSFWYRLALSIRPNFETASGNAAMKLETRRVTISGGFLDNEKVTVSKFMPTAYAYGLTGKVEF